MNHKEYKQLYFGEKSGWIRKLIDQIPDVPYLKWIYKMQTGKKLDLEAPKEYNEWLQFLKLNCRRSEMAVLADKYMVRKWVEEKIGTQYVIPVLGIWDNPDAIDFSMLPKSFVIKCTHDSGSIIVCKDRDGFDKEAAIEKLRKRMQINYFYYLREWPYFMIKPRIIAESLLLDPNKEDKELYDYKFFCFSGEPYFVMTVKDRFTIPRECVFDMSFNPLDVSLGNKTFSYHEICKPQNFDKMVSIARLLSNGYPHVRVDLYNIDGKIYFGEMTFFHWGGFALIEPQSFSFELGRLIEKGYTSFITKSDG